MRIEMNLHLYRISADGGKNWTVQWLTEEDVKHELEYGHLCEKNK